MSQDTILGIVHDFDVLLAMEPEELAPILLQVAKQNLHNGQFHPNNIQKYSQDFPSRLSNPALFMQKEKEIDTAISEGWNWLRVQGLVVPAPDINGTNGWMVLSRRAKSITSNEDFQRLRQAAAFPKSMLHSSIADKVWLSLARGDLSDAVFIAFRTVEEAVRKAGGYGPTDIGVPLMRKAFEKDNGPLTDKDQPEAEREALAHLFAGSIGSYKNPHSHRTVTITDAKEAQEMVLLASHLLRIVDSRST
jgi:uncharacterized protein (TIGR02391 family)